MPITNDDAQRAATEMLAIRRLTAALSDCESSGAYREARSTRAALADHQRRLDALLAPHDTD